MYSFKICSLIQMTRQTCIYCSFFFYQEQEKNDKIVYVGMNRKNHEDIIEKTQCFYKRSVEIFRHIYFKVINSLLGLEVCLFCETNHPQYNAMATH